MEGIFVSWGEKLKVARETLLMPKLEDVHKDALKKFEGQTLTGAAEQRYRRVPWSTCLGCFVSSGHGLSYFLSGTISIKT